MIDWLLDAFQRQGNATAIVYRDAEFSYAWLIDEIAGWTNALAQRGVGQGSVITLSGDYSPHSIAALLALIQNRNIVALLASDRGDSADLAGRYAQARVAIDPQGVREISTQRPSDQHDLLRHLQERGEPGLLVFSSGSTGKSKAVVHSCERLLAKYRQPRRARRILLFLLMDHIGGLDTLFLALSNGGVAVAPEGRTPESVCSVIERHRVEVLPASPTFLNLLLLSGAYRDYDLSSLRFIAYGAEPMPESTLAQVHAALPGVRLQQTYGMTEVGVLHSRSRASDSLWLQVGGDGFETKVVDGTLFVRGASTMLGYLNAPSPLTEDGWMNTGDQVEVDGEWLHILGRASEIINVGGLKVFPAAVESALRTMENVDDAIVSAQTNPITGQMVVAHVQLRSAESAAGFRMRMRAFCTARGMAGYMVPQKVVLTTDPLPLRGDRFKKVRL